MPTLKTIYKNGIFKKQENVARLLKEDLGALSTLVITDKGELQRLVEQLKPTYPVAAAELLQKPNVAIIRVIKAGWSLNGNYYDSKVLKELVSLVESQGPIQFKNHIQDGTQLDRDVQELVSYSKYVWYDEKTDAVYAAVKFPKEKVDTQWIFNLIQEDPGMMGVSISAAVYVTEDFEKDGKKGDKIDGWAYFDSADYVLFPSAGGSGIEASKIEEKIKAAKESAEETKKKKKIKWKKYSKTNEDLEDGLDNLEYKIEQIKSFLSRYADEEAYHEIQAVVSALSGYLYDCWMYVYTEDYTPEQKLTEIEVAFKKASDVITSLKLFNDPQAVLNENKTNSQLPTKENAKMTLAEFKTQHPEAYSALMQEATTAAEIVAKAAAQAEVAPIKTQNEQLTAELSTVKTELDNYKVKEKAAQHRAEIDKIVKAAELGSQYVTPTFLKTLETQENLDTVKELVDDRKKLVTDAGSGTIVTKETKPAEDKKTKEELDSLARQAFIK